MQDNKFGDPITEQEFKDSLFINVESLGEGGSQLTADPNIFEGDILLHGSRLGEVRIIYQEK